VGLLACSSRSGAGARKARDPLELELPERRVVLDEQGKITEIACASGSMRTGVVEDFMIAANVAAAKALESEGRPVVYRDARTAEPREAGRAEGLSRHLRHRSWRWGRSSRPACSTAC
jgi:exoribonuclease R